MFKRLQGGSAALLGAVGIFSLALVGSGYVLGDGLRRAKNAERSIAVRGVSERDVTADLATWTISFSKQGGDLDTVNRESKRKAQRSGVSSARPVSAMPRSATAASASTASI
jgi:hypothetical protein